MSHPNTILDIHRWEQFEFGYDGWLFIKEISDWRTIAKLAIEAAQGCNIDDYNEAIDLIRIHNHNLAPDSAVKSFYKWIKDGGKRDSGKIILPAYKNFEFEIFSGYVFPMDFGYDIAAYLKVKINKIPMIDSFWDPISSQED